MPYRALALAVLALGCGMSGAVAGAKSPATTAPVAASEPSQIIGAPVEDRVLSQLSARLFPVLSQMNAPDSEAPVALRTMLEARRARIAACAEDAVCMMHAATWQQAEMTALADYAAGVKRLVSPSDDGTGPQLLRELAGINHILAVYGLGAEPRYPQIDGLGSDIGLARFTTDRQFIVTMARQLARDPVDRVDPSVGLALALLDGNNQDQAAAFEDDLSALNGPALALARHMDWSRWRFTALIVTGIGPEDLLTPLSAGGKLNVRLAAERFRQGLAPFIILSGGMAHPRGTRTAEALEMRQALMTRYGIPADRIVVDPYARHTTTNMRNAARLLFAMHSPPGRDALVVTNTGQSAYIESDRFAQRNTHDLGYQPGTVGERLSPYDVTFRPLPASTRVDPFDPLDP